MKVLGDATTRLKKSVQNSISLSAGCDLFTRFVLRNINEYGVCIERDQVLFFGCPATNIWEQEWETCKKHLIQNGRLFVQRAMESRDKIARNGLPFIRDDDVS